MSDPIATAILLAGGSGTRMLGQIEDKILAPIAGKPVISYSIEAFVSSGQVQNLVIVTRDAEQQAHLEQVASAVPSGHIVPNITFTTGGAQRQDSVYAGLQAAPADTQIVLIHDGARPCVTPEAICESITKASEIGAACVARPVTDTIKSADTYDGAYLPTTVERSKLWATETPQTFRYPLILSAYQTIIESETKITDDLSAIEDIDQAVAFIDNHQANPKITTSSDLAYLEYLLGNR